VYEFSKRCQARTELYAVALLFVVDDEY